MKKKSLIILGIIIVVFTIAIIPKDNIVQTDTFWDIPIREIYYRKWHRHDGSFNMA